MSTSLAMGKSSNFTGGSLNFKGDKKKSKKKSKKSKHKIGDDDSDATKASPSKSRREEKSRYQDGSGGDEGAAYGKNGHPSSDTDEEELTAAEKRSRKFKKQRETEEMKKVVSLSHRERVEQFNEKLGKLTELNDIPRVSAAGNG
ncbi:hypothetical protein ACHAXT_006743 [Thalassiosira profunda]